MTTLRRFFWLAIFMLMVVAPSFGADSKGGGKKEDYATLLEKAKNPESGADFQALRYAYAQSPGYNPYEIQKDINGKMKDALKSGDFKKASELGENLLKTNYLSIDAHLCLAYAYLKLGDKKKADFHRYFCKSLIDSIIKSGDGKTPETAFQVIAVAEEYAVMGAMGCELVKTSLISNKQGHSVDANQVRERSSGKEGTIYFNVDRPYKRLRAALEKKAKK